MKERKTFTFDGENSADYGLYISGNSVYNAPNREIDMISIPGRNGQLAIDMGRYENITVTYPAFVFADTQEEFREKIRRIRNWLCSKTSYQRLMDEYNPESFRLGLYKSGLEVEPIFYNRCGEFEMSFDCKPQRFLFTGEEVFTLGEWGETETYSGSIVSFEGTETTAIKTLNANIVPKQSGSGDPSPSNVRPISGYSDVNVTRCGKNLCNLVYGNKVPSISSGQMVSANGWSTEFIKIDTSKDYVLSLSGNISRYVLFYDKNQAYISGLADFTNGYRLNNYSSWANVGYVKLRTDEVASASPQIQLELGTTATAYEPYQGTSYPISLGQTVYGGTLDVVSGKLIIDRAFATIDGSSPSNWWTQNGVFLYDRLTNIERTDTISTANDIVISNQYKSEGVNYRGSQSDKTIIKVVANNSQFAIKDTSLSAVADLMTQLNNTPLQIAYKIATPTEITLTPTQVKTLLGNNNILADSGDVEVEIGENPYILVNPTKFEATPIFEVEGSGTLSVGDTTLTINNEGTTIIDTEMMEAYEDDNGAIISRNDDVEGGFPTLTSGINNVEADGLTSVKVTPKWWEL